MESQFAAVADVAAAAEDSAAAIVNPTAAFHSKE